MLSIDISHAASFLPLPYQAALRPRLERAANWLQQGGGKGSDFIGWVKLPRDYDREEYDRILAAAKTIQADSKALVVIGIGGSYLGARYAIRGGSKKIRNMMFVVLALLFIKMGYELLF